MFTPDGNETIEHCGNFGDDVGKRDVGRERVAGHGDRPPRTERATCERGEVLARVALPVATVDEHKAWRAGILRRVEVDLVALARAVRNIEMSRPFGAQRRGGSIPALDQRGTVGYRKVVVVGGVALGLAERTPIRTHLRPSRDDGLRQDRRGRFEPLAGT